MTQQEEHCDQDMEPENPKSTGPTRERLSPRVTENPLFHLNALNMFARREGATALPANQAKSEFLREQIMEKGEALLEILDAYLEAPGSIDADTFHETLTEFGETLRGFASLFDRVPEERDELRLIMHTGVYVEVIGLSLKPDSARQGIADEFHDDVEIVQQKMPECVRTLSTLTRLLLMRERDNQAPDIRKRA